MSKLGCLDSVSTVGARGVYAEEVCQEAGYLPIGSSRDPLNSGLDTTRLRVSLEQSTKEALRGERRLNIFRSRPSLVCRLPL